MPALPSASLTGGGGVGVSNMRNLTFSKIRYGAYLLAVLGFLYFAEVDWFFYPRKLFFVGENSDGALVTADGDGAKEAVGTHAIFGGRIRPGGGGGGGSSSGGRSHDDDEEEEAIRLKAMQMTERMPECVGKEKLLAILYRVGVDEEDITAGDCLDLPSWEEIADVYGETPVVHGLETCEAYRSAMAADQRLTYPSLLVDGLVGTETEAFSKMISEKFQEEGTGGSVTVSSHRNTLLENRYWFKKLKEVNSNKNSSALILPSFLPIVIVQDPFRWMEEMCTYRLGDNVSVRWKEGLRGRCPNLVPTQREKRFPRFRNIATFEVAVGIGHNMETYNSLAGMWSKCNMQYFDFAGSDVVTFPRLMIRFEDTLFHAQEVVRLVDECLTGVSQEAKPFRYHSLDAANDFLEAMKRYGKAGDRYEGISAPEDKLHAFSQLDPDLMRTFHYPMIPESDIETIVDEKVAKLASSSADECEGKERVLEILLRAGKDGVSQQDCLLLPRWDEVVALYGEEPVVHGMETCERYRAAVLEKGLEPTPRVDGLFDTGTNAFVDALNLNFKRLKERLDYNIPGGKHWLLTNRDWAQNNASSIPFFPIVMVKDPLRWMASMCKAPYTAEWRKGLNGHCPNLVLSDGERKSRKYSDVNETFRVFRPGKNGHGDELYDSLADMWPKFYEAYLDADFPRLIVRFEDTLFHAEEVMAQVTECLLGTPMDSPFRYHLAASKHHGHPSDFESALAKYGRAEGRYDGMTVKDKDYARKSLDPELLKKFHYPEITAGAGNDSRKIVDEKVTDLVTKFEACRGKEEVLKILVHAGEEEIDPEACKALPTWDEVTKLYGDGPVVYGLETCERYRTIISSSTEKPRPQVDGLFNTGTNAFVDSLYLNFKEVDDRKQYNIPGGKHWYLWNRDWAANITQMHPITFLPIVLVRDPGRWMASMCSASYTAKWTRIEGHCPNLVPSSDERKEEKYRGVETFVVTRDPAEGHDGEKYGSLAVMWSAWYRAYVDADFPRLIIRFEDTLFHAEKVMRLVGECMGAPTVEPFKYHMEKSKKKSSTNFATALAKYGKEDGRFDGLSLEDRTYAREALDQELMDTFHYPVIPASNLEEGI